jgi:predicted RNA binding protein YcfA (HicA-like mRNA interferase family)
MDSQKSRKRSHYHLEKDGHLTTIPFHATDLKKKTQENLLKILKEVG